MNNARRIAILGMTHVRDATVLTMSNKVVISVPLYFEKHFIFQSARVQGSELILEGSNQHKGDLSIPDALEQVSHS